MSTTTWAKHRHRWGIPSALSALLFGVLFNWLPCQDCESRCWAGGYANAPVSSVAQLARPCVSVRLMGQLGNQMFQIAIAYAHSRRLGWDFSVPDLVHVTDVGVPENHARFFHHIPCWSCPEGPIIREAEELRYHPLPESPNMVLLGWFQTERYFADYRDDILKLFSFREGHWESLLSQYPKLSHPCKIGVQIRIPFHPTLDHPDFHPLFGRGYFEQAFRTLPQDALYVVVSNHVGAAKDLLSGLELNFLYLSDTDRFDDLLILSKCQHVISSNSTFGWWGAWLGDRPGRRCIFPAPWFAPHGRGREDTKDLIPERWEVIFCPEAIIPPHINPTLNCSSKNPADAIFK